MTGDERFRDHVADPDGCPCGWEGHPQGFRWFPELGGTGPHLPSDHPLGPAEATGRRAPVAGLR